MKKDLKGTMTIEAAIIVPLILGMFMLIIFILFYYHDKNVIGAISHETVVMMEQKDDVTVEEVESYFQKRIEGKLLLFPWVETDVQVNDDEIYIAGTAKRNRMALQVEMKMKRTEPEKFIRNIRRIGAIK